MADPRPRDLRLLAACLIADRRNTEAPGITLGRPEVHLQRPSLGTGNIDPLLGVWNESRERIQLAGLLLANIARIFMQCIFVLGLVV